jgi:predicted ester cyclase
MMPTELKALLTRYIEAVWTDRNPAAVDRFLAPTYQRHVGPRVEPLNRDGQRALLVGFQQAFPDARIVVEEVVAERDLIAFRSRLRGTHRGTFRGIAPTSRTVDVQLVDMIRVADGLFAEQWGGPDLLDLLQQLGATVVARSAP